MNSSQKTKAILVSSIGGALEIYDFSIYVFFVPILALLFFPRENHFISLLNTFGVFAIGYFSRPLGAVLFGHYGDRLGRKKGMLVAIALMALSTVAIGLLPTYASIGIMAPLLLIIFRFLQGFAVGGDLPGAITFVAEYADDSKRGFICSLVYCAVNLGLLLASGIGALLTTLLPHDHLVAWGWRIAFLLGLVIGVVGFYLRSRVAETPYFSRLEQTQDIIKFPLKHLFRIHKKQVFQGIGIVWLFATIIAQIFLFMPTYLNTTVHLPLSTALILNSINIFLFSFSTPFFGWLSDKIGRRPVIIFIAVLWMLFSYPLYSLLNHPDLMSKMAGLWCFAILAGGITGVVPSTLAEMFSTHVRYSGVAISYNIGFAIFAGLTPMIATYLLYQLQFPEAPSFNLIISAIGALIAAFSMKERSTKPL